MRIGRLDPLKIIPQAIVAVGFHIANALLLFIVLLKMIAAQFPSRSHQCLEQEQAYGI